MPAIMSRVVVLPQPDGPRRAVTSPLLISRSIASTASTSPNDFVNSCSSTRIGSALHPTAVDAHQSVLGKHEEHENRRDIVEPDRGEQPVVDEPPLPEDGPDKGAEHLL